MGWDCRFEQNDDDQEDWRLISAGISATDSSTDHTLLSGELSQSTFPLHTHNGTQSVCRYGCVADSLAVPLVKGKETTGIFIGHMSSII